MRVTKNAAWSASLAAALVVQAASANAPAEDSFERKRAQVLGQEMAYVDHGKGHPVVFLHGNPTSSYLWRNIMPGLEGTYRVIAPDLIGMGQSAKPDLDYSFKDHQKYLFAFLEKLDLSNATLVLHDWGSALGLEWARQNEDRVHSLVMMEAVLPPGWPAPSYEAMGPAGEVFKALRTEGVGEKMVLEDNFFITTMLGQQAVLKPLAEDVLAVYDSYYPTPKSRKPMLAWTRQVPIAGTPEDVTNVVKTYSEWLASSELPKLLLYAEPGMLITAEAVDWLKQNVRNLTAESVGQGVHFLQEDAPEAITAALKDWLAKHPTNVR